MNRSAKRGYWTKLNGFTWASRPILPLFKTCSESKWTHVIFKQILSSFEWTSHCQGEIVGRYYYYVLNSPFHPFDNPSYTIALWWTIERLSWALWALGSGLMTVLQEGIYVFKQAPCPSVRTARQKNALVFQTIILQEILYFLLLFFRMVCRAWNHSLD